MEAGTKKRGIFSRRFKCAGCGGTVAIPLLWATGIESVFRCRKCGRGFGTGYKAGAVLFALAFTLAVATVNMLCYIVGSGFMMIMFFAAFPLWLVYGFLMRKAWMLRRSRKHLRRQQP